MKPAKPGTNLYLQKADESQRNVISLLSRWENLSNETLTSAVQSIPKSKPKMDGQSRDVLENTFENVGQAPGLPLDAKVDNDEVSQSRTNRKPRNKKLENSEN